MGILYSQAQSYFSLLRPKGSEFHIVMTIGSIREMSFWTTVSQNLTQIQQMIVKRLVKVNGMK